MPDLIDQLRALPDGWGLVAVGKNKRPYQDEWQLNPLSKAQVEDEIKAGRAHAVGVLAGPVSGGLLFVDHDGISASEVLADIGAPLATLPKSWAMTSGRDGRLQIIYQVPERYWEHIKTKKIKSGKQDEQGNNEQLELRWTGCQSVVIGEHPMTGSYKWLPKRSPNEEELNEAPTALIEQMLREKTPEPAPLLLPPIGPQPTDSERARTYLEALNTARADDYDDWLTVGMALHSLGDPSLLSDWQAWSTASAKHKPGDCEKKWKSFKQGSTNLGSLGHFAKQDGWKPSRKSPTRSAKTLPSISKQTDTSDENTTEVQVAARKLEPIELLQHLRKKNFEEGPNGAIRKKKNLEIRYNIFTQQIEILGQAFKGAERFYLALAELGYKVAKDLAFDCLVAVAQENEHDPVRQYLEFVADNVEPTYIEALATQYLRPDDQPGTLYDEMIKRTLIAAVKRCFEPGAKHDTACVLMGDQGARKSSFWNVLGGEFFSDSLKDISSKDDLMILHRSWLMEWAELDHLTGKKHAGQVKAFLSQHTDTFRVPYGKATEQFPRRGIIVGSTNKSTGFLVDETGNRRFWVIPTPLNTKTPINTAALALERDSIWAAAVLAYRKGESSFLSVERETEVAEENTDYLVTNPWQPVIENWLVANTGSVITTEAILTEAVMKPIERQTKGDQMQVADVLKRLGYERKRIMLNGSRCWRWERL
tara:strand:- start:998 stop:3115 length:2118 start_codon:yes stop_codon:yes gene_type:complete